MDINGKSNDGKISKVTHFSVVRDEFGCYLFYHIRSHNSRHKARFLQLRLPAAVL